jgi:hypothetical protein
MHVSLIKHYMNMRTRLQWGVGGKWTLKNGVCYKICFGAQYIGGLPTN